MDFNKIRIVQELANLVSSGMPAALKTYREYERNATEVLLQKDYNGQGLQLELVGYCRASPLESFGMLYKDFKVYAYKDILHPVNCRFGSQKSCLVLRDLIRVPQGIIIAARTVNDLDLEFAKEQSQISEEQHYDALKRAIELAMVVYKQAGNGGYEPVNYFDLRQEEQRPFQEKLLAQLLEVASVTLGIKEPTVKDLEFIIGSYTPQLAAIGMRGTT